VIATAKTDCCFSINPMPTGRKSNTPQQIIFAFIKQNDPEKVGFLKKQIDDANGVITQLRSSKSNMAKLAKAAAEEKVRRIKEQIKMLKMMGGDPKMVAKQIAQLSKELALAAREYLSGAAGARSFLDSGAEAATSIDKDISAAAQQGSIAGNTALLPAASATTVSGELDSSGEKGENDESVASGSASKTQPGEVQDKNKLADQKDALRQQLINDIQNNADEISSKTAVAEADRKFARELIILAAQLKLLARQQEQHLHLTGEYSTYLEIAKTNQALAEVEKCVSDLLAQAINVIV
jgi:hypothetical protein